MPKYYIGTAGWSYKDWVGSFYPRPQSATFDFLTFYSNYFNLVEVNATYYAYMNPSIVKGWINKVEEKDDFLFIIKLHQDFTHKRNFTQENLTAVMQPLDLLQKSERLGGILIQFPYSFVKNAATLKYVNKLFSLFSFVKIFIEVRHKSWFDEEIINLLHEKKVTLCAIDLPVIEHSLEFKPVPTGSSLYVRLHGRNEEAWLHSTKTYNKKQSYEEQSARYEYLYSPSELIDISLKIKESTSTIKEIFVIANNHPKGNAVANSFELIHYLENKDQIHIPKSSLQSYPRLVQLL
jgi:uncharacterized protein YecE (DUF72 family)